MSGTVRITKEFSFGMAHALWNYDGACKNIHGHTYHLSVTLIGSPINDATNHKNGMLIDFGQLKKIIKENIIDQLDHALILNANAPYSALIKNEELYEKVVFLAYQPTCENMLMDFAGRIKKLLPPNAKLFSIKLRETETSFAEWYADDNK